MRRSIYRGELAEARALFQRAPFVHLAGTSVEGEPIVKVVHGVVVDDTLCFHAARAGEKLELLGRPVVAWTQEVVAEIPSYFIDPAVACPATTYYRSAQVRTELGTIDGLTQKAAVMQALMERFQPEAGHDPITPDDRRYRPSLKGLLVGALPLRGASAKMKLGQNRRPEQMCRILEALWRRGGPGDVLAIEALRAANPGTPTPAFLAAPEPFALTCAPTPDDLDDAVDALRDTYWNAGLSCQQIADAQVGATAWVGAHDADGQLVATARAVSDGTSYAYIGDVAVAPRHRSRGLGRAVVGLLLDHPAVRHARRVRLATLDAHELYATFGFTPLPTKPAPWAQMGLDR